MLATAGKYLAKVVGWLAGRAMLIQLDWPQADAMQLPTLPSLLARAKLEGPPVVLRILLAARLVGFVGLHDIVGRLLTNLVRDVLEPFPDGTPQVAAEVKGRPSVLAGTTTTIVRGKSRCSPEQDWQQQRQ